MAPKLALCIALLVLASASVEGRGNIEWGLSEDYNLAYHKIHSSSVFPLSKQTESALVRVSRDEKIEAIRTYDLTGDSTSVVHNGGLGEYYVTIELESARARGEPLGYLIEVYAVKK